MPQPRDNDDHMPRALIVTAVLVAAGVAGLGEPHAAQQAVRLTIAVVLTDASGAAVPVPQHALLVSDYPPSAAPQHIVTAPDGTAGLNLRPGRYIVESDRPVALDGQAYRWIEIVDVAADGGARLELTAANARVQPMTDETDAMTIGTPEADAAAGAPIDVSPTALRRRWRDSVVAIWTPTGHASGLVIDARGVIATSRRAIGDATDVEVQLGPDLEVAGRVVAADTERDVALVRIDPSALASVTPATLDCSGPVMPLRDEDEVYTIGAPLRGLPSLVFGTARRVNSRLVVADFNLRRISLGGPVLADDGRLVGLTSVADPSDEFVFVGDSPIVSADHVCAAARSAEDAAAAPAPAGTHLPVDPAHLIPADELEAAVAARAGNVSPYTLASSDFDVAFLTPAMVYAALRQADPPTMNFSNWTEYVWDAPPVLLVRVTPKQSEGFWAKLMRGAAMTQGQSMPPITSFKSGFSHLQAFCGEDDVTPVHPFRLELRISETEAVHEGLYVFAADAFGAPCGSVKLMLYSEDKPDEADALEIDPAVLERIRQDFTVFATRRRR